MKLSDIKSLLLSVHLLKNYSISCELMMSVWYHCSSSFSFLSVCYYKAGLRTDRRGTVSHVTQEEPGAPALVMTPEPSPTRLGAAEKVCKSLVQRFRLASRVSWEGRGFGQGLEIWCGPRETMCCSTATLIIKTECFREWFRSIRCLTNSISVK